MLYKKSFFFPEYDITDFHPPVNNRFREGPYKDRTNTDRYRAQEIVYVLHQHKETVKEKIKNNRQPHGDNGSKGSAHGRTPGKQESDKSTRQTKNNHQHKQKQLTSKQITANAQVGKWSVERDQDIKYKKNGCGDPFYGSYHPVLPHSIFLFVSLRAFRGYLRFISASAAM